jgi:tRNA-specific 2-thiouridylase
MKIAMLLSGGVDSSVALAELARSGEHEITAFYLKIWLEDELSYLGNCPWEEDLSYAEAVCQKLGVELKVIPLQKEYWERVVHHTIAELKKGHTPSPDILCNQRVKFGAFYDTAGHSFDKIATGHYADIVQKDGMCWLKKGNDPVKDQTYFLSHISQEQLSRCLFPIGAFPKKKVRELAQEYDLSNKDRRDSQGICFLGKIKYNEFVKAHLGERPGEIIEWETKKKLGTHNGFWFHTIGQRKGLGLGGGPWFVVAKDTDANIIYVSSKEALLNCSRETFVIGGANWISAPPAPGDYTVKIRHGERTTPCTLQPVAEKEGYWEIMMKEPDPGVAAGQYAVLYDEEICLGGGIIQYSPDGEDKDQY